MTGHEDEIVTHFRPKNGDIVVDVGAHIGHYTLIASKRVGNNGKVISIEADAGNFEMLNKNIKLNELTNIVSLNCAAFSDRSRIRLFTPVKESGRTLYNTIISERIKPGEQFTDISADKLDNLLYKNKIGAGIVSWIKIDVEGAELEVLKGATNTLSQSKNLKIIIEVHSINLYEELVQFLSIYNYKIEFEEGSGGWRHVIAGKEGR